MLRSARCVQGVERCGAARPGAFDRDVDQVGDAVHRQLPFRRVVRDGGAEDRFDPGEQVPAAAPTAAAPRTVHQQRGMADLPAKPVEPHSRFPSVITPAPRPTPPVM
ncbi:hypothetical protein NORO109296_23250 [Nocardiopsis rhodophaea]